jgi:hypothetical protein
MSYLVKSTCHTLVAQFTSSGPILMKHEPDSGWKVLPRLRKHLIEMLLHRLHVDQTFGIISAIA